MASERDTCAQVLPSLGRVHPIISEPWKPDMLSMDTWLNPIASFLLCCDSKSIRSDDDRIDFGQSKTRGVSRYDVGRMGQ